MFQDLSGLEIFGKVGMKGSGSLGRDIGAVSGAG
jgi:hypothetical protein